MYFVFLEKVVTVKLQNVPDGMSNNFVLDVIPLIYENNLTLECLFDGILVKTYWPFIDQYQREWSPECGGSLP